MPGGQREWLDVPLSHTVKIGRGAGVADMAYAIQSGRPHRASGALALHVLDIMCSLEESAARAEQIEIKSTLPTAVSVARGFGANGSWTHKSSTASIPNQ